MKTGLRILSVLLLASSFAFAQDYNKGLKKELEVEDLYPSKKAAAITQVEVTKVKTQDVQEAPAPTVVYGPQLPPQTQQIVAAPQVQVQAVAPAAPVQQQVTQPQPIFILQQPTTTIEATPVKESRTEQLRKQREEVERQNEMKLMERLEDERLNAEKERSEKILTNQSAAPVATPTPAPQVQMTPAPVVVVPVQTEVVPAGSQPKVQEVAPVADGILAKAIVAEKIEDAIDNHKNKMIIGISGGAAEYPSAGNVSGSFALGGSFEIRFPSRIGVEGAVNYSSFDITNVSTCYGCYGTSLVTTMNQWDVSGGFKYNLFKAAISPIVGLVFDYTRRDYASRVTYGYGNPSFTGSNAFSGGAMAGFEIKASDSILIGGSLTYMMNISYRTDNPLSYGYSGFVYNVGVPIESLNYFFATINTKLVF